MCERNAQLTVCLRESSLLMQTREEVHEVQQNRTYAEGRHTFHLAKHAQVVKESMRMFPVSASGLGRYTKEATVIGGYLIPAGCEIQVFTFDSAQHYKRL